MQKLRTIRFAIIFSWKFFIRYLYDLKKAYLFMHRIKYVNTPKNYYEFQILAHTHVVEKGLSMHEMRQGFGKNIVKNLRDILYKSHEKNASNSEIWKVGANILCKYYETCNNEEEEKDVLLSKEDIDFFERNSTDKSGIDIVAKESYFENSKAVFDDLVVSRRSVRTFNAKVPLDSIKKSVELAIHSPSACNKQPIKVYYTDKEMLIKEALEHQAGSRGFKEKIPQVLVLTASVAAFSEVKEIFSPYLDGGIFIANLLNALYSKNVASCVLNWFHEVKDDKKFRQSFFLPDDEVIIAIIAVGDIPDKLFIPKSYRKVIDDIFCELQMKNKRQEKKSVS